jgi:hypothetical protein
MFQTPARFRNYPLPKNTRSLATSIPVALTTAPVTINQDMKAVERLLKYRTALITAAVTGKIDVRKTVVSG